MKASAILCTYRRDKELLDTISQLLEQNIKNEYEILVVDQKPSHSESVSDKIKKLSQEGKIRYYETPFAGLTKARNFAAEKAASDILVFIDDDVLICDNFIKKHLAMYERNDIHAVSGLILDRSGKRNLNYKKLHGTNFSVLKEAYFEAGGSDEALGIHSYTEDIIFSDRLLAKGKKIAYCAEASVKHLLAEKGGCRITDSSQKTCEWEKSFSRLYLFYLKGAFKKARAWRIFWSALRDGPLRKDMVTKAWLQPYAWLGFFKANIRAIKAVKGKRLI